MGYINKSGILVWDKYQLDNVLATCGVYVLRDALRNIIYIGKSETSLKDRLLSHWNSKDIPNIAFFDWYQTSDALNARLLEERWVGQYKPKHNTQLK